MGAWDWLILAPDSLYRRPPHVLLALIDGIILSTNGVWAPESTSQWLKVLQRSDRLGNFDLRIKLCVQALRYCFANRSFPLGPIVAEVFSEVHAVTTDKHSTVDTSSLFGFFDHWDKGKQLRRDLIDGFMGSGWSPADLAAAPKDDGLLRKVVKRLLRNHGGDRYLDRMRGELSNSENKIHRTAKNQLDRVLTELDYQDDWD